MTQDQTQDDATTDAYDADALQAKWQPVWQELDPFRAGQREGAEKRYALTMFPYPSGDLHMGHAEVMALHDVIARYWWHRGYDVLNPMGWDSFGLPAENAAIRNDEHPATYTYGNIETQFRSFQKYAVSFDWSRRLHTSDPEYYRWTQWLFLKFRERGLAYRKNSPVNRAGQRAGAGRRHLRAVRRRGDQEGAHPVVLQDHRLLPAPARRPGRAGGPLA
jgi:leucyl-tRNA synthetase